MTSVLPSSMRIKSRPTKKRINPPPRCMCPSAHLRPPERPSMGLELERPANAGSEFAGVALSETVSLIETPREPLESARRLLQHPSNRSPIVIAITQVVIQRGKAVRLAGLLHFVELLHLELVISDGSPIICSRVHRKTRRERPIDTDDHVVLPGAAIPRFHLAAHEILHVVQPLY